MQFWPPGHAIKIYRNQFGSADICYPIGDWRQNGGMVSDDTADRNVVRDPSRDGVCSGRLLARMVKAWNWELNEKAHRRAVARISTLENAAWRAALTRKEVRLLAYLFFSDGRTVDRKTLMRRVFGYHPDTKSHTLETHVYRIRQKLEPIPGQPRFLLFTDGGYRLVTEPEDERPGPPFPPGSLPVQERQTSLTDGEQS